jgi:hypothetical protein
MKKLLIGILMLISLASYSQTTSYTIAKVILNHNFSNNISGVGVDIGGVFDYKKYAFMEFSLPIVMTNPAYFNFGYGYFINKTTYIAALAGVYSPTRTYIKFNLGGEFGIINNKIVTSIFVNTNYCAGIKIGYRFNDSKF